ncbi:class I SAM-dependent methyltransferase [Parasphingorhabdus flavimaris]|uniref:Class I SAM-dependent methyltransferase n=1 Tax=Parasphingorhabdus flavimaris TaxID=266812 RepID=A0ABX2N138_9SPHN|nr:cyclopropane-fatty-acyl-phospholipid synthase family protein [Parasphingorhabdus flavimaris]NVD27400.1 class I SAM-dependent methyltransferase [Parasphingorhabdus flavimaris]|tara:strand:- start:14465 stop:15709 length:1245 start_codon:yes stop_codon:yes gene_type:complete
MNVETPKRGQHLLDARKRFATGSGFFARLFAPGFHHILDRIDAGMDHGTFEGKLPDGTTRILGGRGDGPMVTVDLHSWNALLRLINGGSVGWYRAWELGEWESDDLVSVFDLFTRNREGLKSTGRASGFFNWVVKRHHKKRGNDKRRARQNIQYHYDLGNDFYRLWLDESMSYSSAIFSNKNNSLADAQHDKIASIAERLLASPGDSVLEIGCGWGSLSGSLARDHGLDVTGISLSDEQTAWAREHHPEAQFLIQDYRDVEGQYDAIASVEMVEAVGQQYWPDFLDCIARNLKPGGRAAVQYISIADDIFEQYASSADFIQTYIFPGGMLLSESRFRALAEERGLQWSDQQNFGLDYAETLRIWRERFDDAVERGALPTGFDERFVRLWRFYLAYCEGGFRGGGIDVAQVTLIK